VSRAEWGIRVSNSETQQGNTPIGSPEPAASGPARRPAVSRGAVVALVIGLVALFPLLYFSEAIVGAVTLQAWSKAGAVATIQEFANAVQAGDEAKLQSLAGPAGFKCTFESGRIVRLKTDAKAAQKPEIPTERALPTSFVPGPESRYLFGTKPPLLVLVLPAQEGRVSFDMTRAQGKWRILGLSSLGPGGGCTRPQAKATP